MRHSLARTARLAFAGAVVLLAVACGRDDTVDDAAINAADANLMLEEPANDATALEAVTAVPEVVPATNAAADNVSAPATEGGDTGGNTLDSNVSGM